MEGRLPRGGDVHGSHSTWNRRIEAGANLLRELTKKLVWGNSRAEVTEEFKAAPLTHIDGDSISDATGGEYAEVLRLEQR